MTESKGQSFVYDTLSITMMNFVFGIFLAIIL